VKEQQKELFGGNCCCTVDFEINNLVFDSEGGKAQVAGAGIDDEDNAHSRTIFP
jgi:hypothetical protein